MNGSVSLFVACAIACCAAGTASAQVNYRPTAPPVVTAENEPWYLAGEPVMYAGNIYYPTGPQVYFNGNDMVRSGFFHAIPLYTRTTIEPYSLVFVPLRGGLMKPYERRRAGDLAGTVGSTTPSFPVVRSSEPSPESIPQAAAPPTLVSGHGPVPTASQPVDIPPAAESVDIPARWVQPPLPVGTAAPAAPLTPAPVLRPSQPAQALFIDFKGRRWISTGQPVPLDRSRMVRIGDHHGFAVYAEKAADPDAILVPVSRDAAEFVARYSLRPPR